MPQTSHTLSAAITPHARTNNIAKFEELRDAVRDITSGSTSVAVVEKPNSILLVPVSTGFPIHIMLDDRRRPILFLGCWFDDGECGYGGILQLVRYALNSELRVRTTFYNTSRGNQPHGHAVERRFEDGSWATIAENTYPSLRSLWFRRQYAERFEQYPSAEDAGQ